MNLQLTRTSIETTLRSSPRLTILISVISALLLVSGCATQAPVEEVKVDHQKLWPAPPEQARIRYIGELNSLEGDKKKTSIRDVLMGEETNRVASLSKPYAVYSDSKGRVFVADTGIMGVVVFDLNQNKEAAIWGSGGAGAITKPGGVTSDEQGNVYVSDTMSNRVVVFNAEGKYINAYGDKEIFGTPAGLAYNEQTQRLYVVDTKKHKIFVFDKDGNVDFTIGENGTNPGYFNFPTNIAIDANGRLYVADSMNFRIQVLEMDGTYVSHFGENGDRLGDFYRLKGVGVDTNGNIYAVDASFQNFQVFNQQGNLLLYVGDGGSGAPGKFALPAGIHVDKNNQIFIADQYNQRIQMFEFLGDSVIKDIE
jgi:DNA-binding beta-propeller fold protein YncE